MRSHKHLYMGTWLSSLCPGVKKYLRAQCYNDHDEASHWSDTQIGVAVCCRSLNAVLHMPTWCLKKNNGKGIEPRLWDAEAVKTGWPYVVFGTGLPVTDIFWERLITGVIIEKCPEKTSFTHSASHPVWVWLHFTIESSLKLTQREWAMGALWKPTDFRDFFVLSVSATKSFC